MLLKKYLPTLPGFEFMTEEDVEHVAAAMRVENYADGHVFIYQDKLAREFHLLLEGAIDVCYYGPSERYYKLRTLQPGDFFGGLSLADGKPSLANHTADGDVRVASLPLSAFMLLYQPHSEIGCHFQHVVATQLAQDLRARHDALRNLLAQLYSGPPTSGGAAP